MDLTWGKGVASTDRWFGVLDGVWTASEGRRATHLVVKRGFLLSRKFTVPFEHLARCNRDGVYLGLSTLELLALPRAGGGNSGPSGVLLDRSTGVMLDGGLRPRLTGVRISSDATSLTHVMLKLRGLARRTMTLPLDSIAELRAGQIAASLGPPDLPSLPSYRPDPDIETDVWEVLSPVDMKGIALTVTDGIAVLEGNVRTPEVSDEASRLARSVEGVASVESRLVSDWEINLAVAEALAHIDPSLSESVAVHCHLGTVSLQGLVRSERAKRAILQGAREVRGVRAVTDEIETLRSRAAAARSRRQEGPQHQS